MRRRLLIGAVVLVVGIVVFALLQVPPLDGWRYHTVATWHPTPSREVVSPTYSVPKGSPFRITFRSDDGRGAEYYLTFVASDYSGNRKGNLVFLHHWRPEPILWRATARGDHVWLRGISDTFYVSGPRDRATRFQLDLGGNGAPYDSPLTITVSVPYGYYYLPVEDYLIGLAILAGLGFLVARRLSRSLRRRQARPLDGVGEVPT